MDLDKAKIAKILEVPEEMVNRLLHSFITQAEGALAELRTAIEEKNLSQIKQRGHFIKGSAGLLRLQELYVIAEQIETGADEGRDLETIRLDVEKFGIAFGELKKLI